jgi:hypothetical protein
MFEDTVIIIYRAGQRLRLFLSPKLSIVRKKEVLNFCCIFSIQNAPPYPVTNKQVLLDIYDTRKRLSS